MGGLHPVPWLCVPGSHRVCLYRLPVRRGSHADDGKGVSGNSITSRPELLGNTLGPFVATYQWRHGTSVRRSVASQPQRTTAEPPSRTNTAASEVQDGNGSFELTR